MEVGILRWPDIWLIWLSAVFISFGVLEGIALHISRKDTLSDTVWTWFQIAPGQPFYEWTLGHIIAVAVLATLAIVLVLHLGLGLFR